MKKIQMLFIVMLCFSNSACAISEEDLNRRREYIQLTDDVKYRQSSMYTPISQSRLDQERRARSIRDAAKKVALKKQDAQKAKDDIVEAKQKVEYDILDKKAIAKGYVRYSGSSVVKLIAYTQRNGGLEKYNNMVFGCQEMKRDICTERYSKLTVSQVLPNGVVYTIFDNDDEGYFRFAIITDKLPGVIYQDGQAFPNTFHAFVGMTSATTVLGVTKYLPSFKHVDLSN